MENTTTTKGPNYQYKPRMTRRDSLKWLGILSASAMVPTLAACDSTDEPINPNTSHWPDLSLDTIKIKGYGKDPNLVSPDRAAWPRTLTQAQLTLVAILSDIIVPRDGNVPAATEVGVPDVIDEWVSAPYARQRGDRGKILAILSWIDTESEIRFGKVFAKISLTDQMKIIDDIAYQKEDLAKAFTKPADTFSSLRRLVLAAFYCSPEGSKDLGYMGNIPIAGDYPGPTDEAMAHLNKALKTLNLTL